MRRLKKDFSAPTGQKKKKSIWKWSERVRARKIHSKKKKHVWNTVATINGDGAPAVDSKLVATNEYVTLDADTPFAFAAHVQCTK